MDCCFFRNVSYFQTWFGYFTYIKRNGPNIFWVSKNVLDFQMFYPVLNISTCWNEREVVINLSKPRRSVRLDRGGRSLDQQKLKRSSHSSIQNVHGLIEVLLAARGFSSLWSHRRATLATLYSIDSESEKMDENGCLLDGGGILLSKMASNYVLHFHWTHVFQHLFLCLTVPTGRREIVRDATQPCNERQETIAVCSNNAVFWTTREIKDCNYLGALS